jgi:hypothetical protein
LPYHKYLAHIAEHPEQEAKLQEIRVLVEEPALLPGFKYVSEQINDDHALALLYKLKRAFIAVQADGIAEADDELALLDEFIEDLWAARGLYPGLGSVLSVLADLSVGEPQKETTRGQALADALAAHQAEDTDLLDEAFALLAGSGQPPSSLAIHKKTLRDARAGFRDHKVLLPLLRKLSLFALTPRQVARILFPDGDGHAFGGQDITKAELAANPYLLSESYVPATEAPSESAADLDREQRTDGLIDYFTIDIGMFPDGRYVDRNDDLQNLTVAGPERLRAFAMEALVRNETQGHSFAPLSVLLEDARGHPLFYRDSIALSEEQVLSDDHLSHFRKRLHVREHDGEHFFYLQRTKEAEEIIHRFVSERIKLSDLTFSVDDLHGYLEGQAATISEKIDSFDSERFKIERRTMMGGALRRSFYCVTGRPGSGKTQALHAVLNRIEQAGERAIVLAPTGKAALRLNEDAGPNADWKAETIDRWIFRSGLGEYLEGTSLSKMTKSPRFEATDNFVIDEMSMVDLHRLALLFRAIEVHQPGSIKGVILVGDENQLPPIGCGRPFHDIINYLPEDATREGRNIVRLTTNCRQEHDSVVLDAAHLFAGKNRYHTELFDSLLAGGQISPFLRVGYWEDPEELQSLVVSYLEEILSEVPDRESLSAQESFNNLLGLYGNGYVPKNDAGELKLDRAQILTPYRGGPSGSIEHAKIGKPCFPGATQGPKRLAFTSLTD